MFVYIATLLAMLGHWVEEGKPHLPSMAAQQTIPYISNIGATGLKPLFIAGSTVTVVFLDLAFLAERWLRHRGTLVSNKGRFDKFCSIASIFFGISGALGLILLSIFDTLHHHKLHDGFLVLFIGGYLLSAIFICLEYWRLGVYYRNQHMILFVSFWVKVVFVVVEIGLAIAFGICNRTSKRANSAAVLEWVIALIFTFYVLSFTIDLLPAVRTRHHIPQGEKELSGNRSSTQDGVVDDLHLATDSLANNSSSYRGQVIDGHTASPAAQNRRALDV